MSSSTAKEQSISEVEYDGRKYSLVVIPALNTKIVVQETQEIKRKLHLDALAYDLNSLGLLLRLAHYGVVGHVDLEIKVRRAICNAVTICDDTVHMVNEFERASQNALDNMQAAYQYLEEDLEEDAIETLQEVVLTAQKMQTAADELSKKCKIESENLLKVQEATSVKKGNVDDQIKQANINLHEQKSQHKTHKEIIAKEEAAAIETKAEIEAASKNKSVVFKTKDEYLEEEQQKLAEISSEKQKLIQQLQMKLGQNLNQIQSSLKKKLQQNESKYQDSLLQNDNLMKSKLQENIETLKRQQKTILDERHKSEATSKSEYQAILESKSNEIENQLKLEEGDFTLQHDKGFQENLKKIEKEYEEKVAQYDAQYKRQIQDNEKDLEKLKKDHERNFHSQKEFYEQEHDKRVASINASYGSKEQDINQKYGSPTKLSETSLQDRINIIKQECADQIKENEEQYEKHTKTIETQYSENEKQFKEDLKNSISALEEKDEVEYNKLQELVNTPIVMPSEPSQGFGKRIKTAILGNQQEINARDRQKAEAEAMQDKLQLAKDQYEKNKSSRNKMITKAQETLNTNQRYNKNEKDRRMDEALKQKNEKNYRSESERDLKIKAAKEQKSLYDEKVKSFTSNNEEKSKAITSADTNSEQDIRKAKNKQIEDNEDAEKLRDTKNEEAEKIKNSKCEKALDDKEKAIMMLKKVTIEAKTSVLKLKAQNEAKLLALEANENARLKWESENRHTEEKKAEADAKVYADKTKNDEKFFGIKKQNDEEAIEKAEKDESKVKSEYEMKLKELEQRILHEEMKIKEHFTKKYENVQKQYEDLKRLEEHHRKQQEEHEKQRKLARIKMAEAAQKIASFQNEVEVKESSQYCLNQAVSALREIQDIMLSTSKFWKDTEAICKNVTEHDFTKKVSKINNRSQSSRKSLWESKTFKTQALTYYGKWVALKHVCIDAGKQLSFAQEDVHKYLRENPSPEEAKHLMKELVNKLNHHLAIKDNPAHEK